MLEHGDAGPVGMLAPWLFIGANIVVALVALGTLRLFGTSMSPGIATRARAS